MEIKHTPEPWIVTPDHDIIGGPLVEVEGGGAMKRVAIVCMPRGMQPSEREANAAVIAAAPALAGAARDFLVEHQHITDEELAGGEVNRPHDYSPAEWKAIAAFRAALRAVSDKGDASQ